MTHRRGSNDRLRALLAEAEWTQEALARAVNTLGAEIGAMLRYDRTAVAHWLAGTQPRHPVPQLAAEALSRRIGRSVTPESAGFAGPRREESPTDPVVGFATLCRADADTGRRAALHQRPFRAADAVVPSPPAIPEPRPAPAGVRRGACAAADDEPRAAAREAPESPREGQGARPGEARAEGGGGGGRPEAWPEPRGDDGTAPLHDAIGFFAASIDSHGGRHARSALAAYLADDVVPLLHTPRPVRLRRELLVAASRLAFLLARMYEDGQLHGVAQRYYTYAHRLAKESGDRGAWSVALRAMSAQAQRLGHLPAALQLADAAARATRSAPPPQQAYVQAQLAVVLGATGDRRGTLAAMGRAERATERATSGPGPFGRYPAAALHFQASAALEALGDLQGALTALRRAANERAAADVRGRALTQARFGHLLLRAGHLEEACVAWDSFMATQERLRSGDTERALRDMRQALHPFRNRKRAAELLARSTPRGDVFAD